MNRDVDLQGVTVLVTRPEHQASTMISRLELNGAQVVAIPAIRIDALPVPESIPFAEYDLLLFVSANAVRLSPLLPEKTEVKIAAIGKQTARALEDKGLSVDFVPAEGFTSEDLLALPQLQDLQGKRCLILRGEGGRETLRQELQRRGASVEYLDLYQRVGPRRIDEVALAPLYDSPVAVTMFTSAESVDNFTKALPDQTRERFAELPTVVGSQRIADKIQGSTERHNLIVATDPSDDAMFSALIEWRKREAETKWR